MAWPGHFHLRVPSFWGQILAMASFQLALPCSSTRKDSSWKPFVIGASQQEACLCVSWGKVEQGSRNAVVGKCRDFLHKYDCLWESNVYLDRGESSIWESLGPLSWLLLLESKRMFTNIIHFWSVPTFLIWEWIWISQTFLITHLLLHRPLLCRED